MVEKSVTVAEELMAEAMSECPFGVMLRKMDPDLRGQFQEVLQNPKFSTAAIVRALEKRGMQVSRHRLQGCRKRCGCGAIDLEPGKVE